MGNLLSIIAAIPKIISFIREVMTWVDKWNREKAARKAKEAVDETTRTGDQRAEEEILNPGGSGRASKPEPGLIIRDRRDRSND